MGLQFFWNVTRATSLIRNDRTRTKTDSRKGLTTSLLHDFKARPGSSILPGRLYLRSPELSRTNSNFH